MRWQRRLQSGAKIARRGNNLETWINNAGFGNYDSVAHQDLKKIETMLHLNIEALTILSSLYVRDYKDTESSHN